VVFATQSLDDVVRSSIASALIESCPIQIFLPNPRALEPASADLYRMFGLNRRQLELIAWATPKRTYYLRQPEGCRLFDLKLSGAGLALWQVVLAEAGGPVNLNIALASNPLSPEEWADDLADELDVPFGWLDTPQRDDVLEAARTRVAGALAVWQERGTFQLVDHIVRKVMTRHGIFGEEDVIGTEALLTAVTNEIAEELSHHVVGVPFSRPFTTEDVRRAQALEPKPRKNDR